MSKDPLVLFGGSIRSVILAILVATIFLSSTGLAADFPRGELLYQGKPLQQTQYGTVEGIQNQSSHTLAWLGIPYAKPPVDELRWKAPRNAESWPGVLETKQFRNKSAQLAGQKLLGSEDCLYLNIWRPDTRETMLPVLVFVHGGGNFNGSGETFNGELLAQKTNSIIISVNYRLGVMGWFYYSALKTGDKLDDSGNYGLLDVLKSLEWVRGSIKSFGGNPQNVTLSGQSAGARDVLAALISPLSKGLFQKAICLSGGLTLAEPEQGEAFAQEYMKKLLVKDGVAPDAAEAEEWLANHLPEEIAQYLAAKDTKELTPPRPDNIRMAPFPHLFKDGYVIPKEGFAAIKAGKYNRVPLILGSTSREFTYYTVTEPYFSASLRDSSILSDEKKLKLYRDSVYFGGKMFAGFNVDQVADLIAQSENKPAVYGYRFGWGTREGTIASPWNEMLGAAHAADIDFYTGREEFPFKKLFPGLYYTEENKPGRVELSNVIAAYVKNFLYTGNPNGAGLVKWGTWKTGRDEERILQLDANAQKAIVAMSKESLDKAAILKEMQTTLSDEELQILTGKILNGRFFWEY